VRLYRNIVSGIMVLGLALGLASCKSEEKKADNGGAPIQKTAAVNTVCPVSLEAVDADAPTREYQGKTIGFCCARCPAKWDSKTVAERDAMMAKVAPK
jgi:hypothetical protein